jgi:hypothetical protein
MMPGMRRPVGPSLALVAGLALGLVLAACGDRVEPPAPTADGLSTTVATSSAVPGTRPSPTVSTHPEQTVGATAAPDTLTPTASTTPTPISTESIPATPETLAGYQALTTGLTALFARADKLVGEDPAADPQDADDVKRLVGDVFPDGVDLVVFSGDDALIMCLTGPATTFLLLVTHGDGIRQVLGPGDCSDIESIDAEADGDVVVDITVELVGDRPKVRYVATVVKGQNLADGIPGLEDFIEGLNSAAG